MKNPYLPAHKYDPPSLAQHFRNLANSYTSKAENIILEDVKELEAARNDASRLRKKLEAAYANSH